MRKVELYDDDGSMFYVGQLEILGYPDPPLETRYTLADGAETYVRWATREDGTMLMYRQGGPCPVICDECGAIFGGNEAGQAALFSHCCQ